MKLYHGDCLEIMKQIPDESVDMVLCDLPYGTTACAWDTIIPFDKLWEQYNRIVKENGVVCLFSSQPFSAQLILSNMKDFKEEIIWLKNKAASGFNSDKKHIKIHENIEIFSRSTHHTFNPQKWEVEDEDFITKRKTFKDSEYVGNQIYGATTRTRKVDNGERFPISIVSYKVPFTPQASKQYKNNIDIRMHPTQKPVSLCEYLIKTYTLKDDIVLDNCMGSGTTGVACVNTDRNFIGIELDECYFAIAQERIRRAIEENQTRQLSVFDL